MRGFLGFVASFGEYANIKTNIEDSWIENSKSRINTGKKGKVREYTSLLSVYNSDILKDNLFQPLPPREVELEWIQFILKQYPNMCTLFLPQYILDKILRKIEIEQKQVDWFSCEKFQFKDWVKDIKAAVVPKYRKILAAVRKRQILYYEYQGKTVHILPYALEYDVIRHLCSDIREPMDVMCYNLLEKRTVKIKYKNIVVGHAREKEDYCFSDFDKLYHLLSYGLRCALSKCKTVWGKANSVFEECWIPDKRGNDNYNRCIRKRLNKLLNNENINISVSYREKYEVLYNLILKQKVPEQICFLENVFEYYYKMAEQDNIVDRPRMSVFQWKYQLFLLTCFADACKMLFHSLKGRRLKEKLDGVYSYELWELIYGEERDGVTNEIAFYNEQFQMASISFTLKEGTEENINLIYRLFRNFVCAGAQTKEGELRFTVSYETFYFRKIHMLLMILDPLIDSITPKQTADIIEQRRKNRRGQ